MSCLVKCADIPGALREDECLLIFQRHGESYGNRYGVMSGQTDVPLTERGVLQAETASRAFASEPLDAVYASDLVRASTTAKYHADLRGLPLHKNAGFREIHVGDWECRPKDGARERYGELYLYYFGDGFALYDFRGEYSTLLPESVSVPEEYIYSLQHRNGTSDNVASAAAASRYIHPSGEPHRTLSEAREYADTREVSLASLESIPMSEETYLPEYERKFPVFCGIGETVIGAALRFHRTAVSVAEQNLGKRLLIGTHAGVLRAFFGLMLGIKPADMGRELPFAINASFSYVLYRAGRLIPLVYSDYTHIESIGFLDTKRSRTEV
ncbi:MAG: histidine phosphatase family protein [Clostridia bacterium]|nr:histidine phosphatase family protein [Clostridia bacterium]